MYLQGLLAPKIFAAINVEPDESSSLMKAMKDLIQNGIEVNSENLAFFFKDHLIVCHYMDIVNSLDKRKYAISITEKPNGNN